jgi:glycosyltransferase involved in cell wall biosynthesis
LIASPVDLEWVQQRSGRTNFVLVPQGVELERFPFPENPAEGNRIIFFGKLDTLPNADAAIYFAREIFPRVRRFIPSAEFLVVGWNPPRAVRKLARLPGVVVRANVTEVQPHVAQSAVSVAPMRFGAGIQTKIVESLALGVPVVASPEAALPFGVGDHGPILVAKTAEEFAEVVVRVLKDGAYRERLASAGRSLVESKYVWERVLAPLDDILEELRSHQVAT